jgi:hypothetical protein
MTQLPEVGLFRVRSAAFGKAAESVRLKYAEVIRF